MSVAYGEELYGAGLYAGLPAGALYPVELTIDGVPIDLHSVLADGTGRHGRTGFFDSPSPSTLTFTLLEVTRAITRPFRLGSTVVLSATDGTSTAPRFVGRVTDSTIDAAGALTATAVGKLRELSGITVGTVAYPAESWSARVTRVFAEAGLSSLLVLQVGALNPTLFARPAGAIALDQYLASLAETVEATVADLPDGRILVQAITSRSSAGIYSLDPAEVLYAPEWENRLPNANIITVKYGDPAASVVQSDAASVALYGPITLELETELANASDANQSALNRLARGSYAHWTTPAAPLLVGRRLSIGQMVSITQLPGSAPYDPWQPIVEGWTDRIVSDLEELDWTMELTLSDPALSGLSLAWNGVPTSSRYLWNTINQTVQWRDALTLDSL